MSAFILSVISNVDVGLCFSLCVEETAEDNADSLDELVDWEGDAITEAIVGFVRIVINNMLIANIIGNLLDR